MKKKRKNSKQFNRKFKKRFFTRKSLTVLLAAAIVMVVIGFGCNQQRKRAAMYQSTIDELNTEIENLKDGNQQLEDEKNNMDTDEFKEKMARERLGMIGKDEYSLIESEQQQETAPEEEDSQEQKEESSSEEKSDTEEKDNKEKENN